MLRMIQKLHEKILVKAQRKQIAKDYAREEKDRGFMGERSFKKLMEREPMNEQELDLAKEYLRVKSMGSGIKGHPNLFIMMADCEVALYHQNRGEPHNIKPEVLQAFIDGDGAVLESYLFSDYKKGV